MAARTIVAVSSPPGGAARAVLRLSGPEAGRLVAQRFSGSKEVATDEVRGDVERLPRGVLAGNLYDGQGQVPCFWFWMPGPASFTREDVSEVHIPGSPPLVEAALEAFLGDGAQMAQPGEFTRRAFENGRIDLTRAEGVLGLIEAADLLEVRSATALLFGGLAERTANLREGLDSLRALTEASLDFDTTETGHVETASLLEEAQTLALGLAEAAAWEQRRQSSLGRPRIALAGRPNAGKSSLFNLLVDASSKRAKPALVSDFAGSTRDGKSALWNVANVELELFDAPGFEFNQAATDDGADKRAQVMADATRQGADVILWLLPVDSTSTKEAASDFLKLPASALVIPVATKADLGPKPAWILPPHLGPVLLISTTSDPASAESDLRVQVAAALGLGGSSGNPKSTQASLGRELSARHRSALSHSLKALDEARAGLAQGLSLDLVAEALREAEHALDSISGQTTPEDLLDRIFAGFCLGK